MTAIKEYTVSSPAKLNLSFEITGREQNGYHQLITLFQSIDLIDKLTIAIEPAQENTIVLSLVDKNNENNDLPLDERNLIHKAIQLFMDNMGQSNAVKINVKIEKKIPIGAGLAGGSSNAAATLSVLNQYFSGRFDNAKLVEMAAKLGADVAFCLEGGMAIGRGYGEKLEKLLPLLSSYFLLVKPKSISISTPSAYEAFDRYVNFSYTDQVQAENKLQNLTAQLRNLQSNPVNSRNPLSQFFWNAFEPAIFNEYPVLAEIQKYLLSCGLEAHLTGSGPTIYALLESEEQGKAVIKQLFAKDWGIMAWIVKSIDHGPEILYEGQYDKQAKRETITSS